MKGEMVELGLVCARVIRVEHELILSADRNLKNRFSPEVQERYAKVWKNINYKAIVLREQIIKGALYQAKEIGD